MFNLIAKIFGVTPAEPAVELQRLRSTAARSKDYDITRPDLVNKARVQRRDSESMALLRKEQRNQSVWSTDIAQRVYNRA